MSRYKIYALSLALILGVASANDQERMIKDDLGFPHTLGSSPQRIVSLAPNITEILFALGLEEEIVGVTRYCNYPDQTRTKEKIGGMVDPDLEKIIFLQPDLIIAFRGNPLRLIYRLRDLQLPVFVLEQGTSLESVFSLIRKIGLITHRENPAAALVDSLRKDYERIQACLANVKHIPRVYVNIHGKGLWTCGKDSFLNDLVVKAKGLNIAAEIPRSWLAYNREEIIHQNPEFIIVVTRSQKDFSEIKEWIIRESHLESVLAVKKESIHFLNEDFVTRSGPRIFMALEQLSRILHPNSFRDYQ
ncbi:MAG: ABC transporter substrate-binding protein [Candidatus Aminicenantes bacterium]|nr:ABC transporter substrate-binding protein [Candidatus Aminicenantes bacterium]MDH5383382.1 ABC transporter substrate-binding protein [Candidatus Aminicenantes bacterium]